MLDVHFVILGAAIGSVGAALYLRDTLRGFTQPNRVTWLMWAIAPLLAFAVEVHEGVGLRSLMTFVVGFGPLLIFLASFRNAASAWALRRLDYVCGGLSAAGLVAWLVTSHGTVAIAASIAADALAAIPTLQKSWRFPETETAAAYLAAALNAGITLLTVQEVTTAVVAFPFYILAVAHVGNPAGRGPGWAAAAALGRVRLIPSRADERSRSADRSESASNLRWSRA